MSSTIVSDAPERRALRAGWTASDADVLVYMDVDLSTDLRALLPLVSPLVRRHSEVAIGSRLAAGARVVRGALDVLNRWTPTPPGCSR